MTPRVTSKGDRRSPIICVRLYIDGERCLAKDILLSFGVEFEGGGSADAGGQVRLGLNLFSLPGVMISEESYSLVLRSDVYGVAKSHLSNPTRPAIIESTISVPFHKGADGIDYGRDDRRIHRLFDRSRKGTALASPEFVQLVCSSLRYDTADIDGSEEVRLVFRQNDKSVWEDRALFCRRLHARRSITRFGTYYYLWRETLDALLPYMDLDLFAFADVDVAEIA